MNGVVYYEQSYYGQTGIALLSNGKTNPILNPSFFEKITYISDEEYTPAELVELVKEEDMDNELELCIVGVKFDENNLDDLIALNRHFAKVTWFDDHSKSVRLSNKYTEIEDIEGNRDDTTCIAEMMYNYLYKTDKENPVPYGVRLLNPNHPDHKYFLKGLGYLKVKVKDDVWKFVYALDENGKEHGDQFCKDIVNEQKELEKRIPLTKTTTEEE